MSYKYFVPEIWSAKLQEHLDNELVFANLLNRDYEGDIKSYGDTVYINQIGDVTVKSYTGADIDDPEELTGTTRTLKIDAADYFNVQVKDIDAAQSRYNLMDEATKRSAYEMAETCENYIINKFLTAANTGIDVMKQGSSGIETVKERITGIGSAESPKSVSSDTAWDLLVDLGTHLSEKNVPKAGRWVVLPPWYTGMLTKDPRFSGGGTDGSRQTLASGAVFDNVAGFHVYESNNVPVTSNKWTIIAGTNQAGSFADQLVETEAYRREKNFSDGVKGLHVYGAEITSPKHAATLIVSYTKPT